MKALLLSLALLAPLLAHAGGADLRRADTKAAEDCKALTAGAAAATPLFHNLVSSYVYVDRKFVYLSLVGASATDYIRVSTFSANVSGYPWYPLQASGLPLQIGWGIPVFAAIPTGAASKTVCAYQGE
jgi:hypothetical protein